MAATDSSWQIVSKILTEINLTSVKLEYKPIVTASTAPLVVKNDFKLTPINICIISKQSTIKLKSRADCL